MRKANDPLAVRVEAARTAVLATRKPPFSTAKRRTNRSRMPLKPFALAHFALLSCTKNPVTFAHSPQSRRNGFLQWTSD
jgi:hypothetical protein